MGRWRATQSGAVEGLPPGASTTRLRGALHVYFDSKRGYVARSWPKGNGGDTPARKIARDLFSSVIKGVSNPDALQKLEALRIAKQTPFTWRDVMMSAAFGNLIISVDADGNYWMGWRLAYATVQVLLDSIFNAPGTMLVRAPEGWVALLAGDDGQVLTFDVTAGIPQWKFFSTDVQAILDQLAPSLGDVVKFNGTDWEAVDISALYDASGAAAAALVSANAFTTAAVAALTLPTGADPSASASDVAVNGASAHFMRADAAPAVHKASTSQFGLVKPDGATTDIVSGLLIAKGFAGVGVGFGPGYRSGVFYGMPGGLLGSTTTSIATTIYSAPFYCAVDTTFTKIAFAGGAATGNARLGVYSNSNGHPSALLYDCGTVANVSGFATITGQTIVLTAGWYHLAIIFDGARSYIYTNTSSLPELQSMWGYTTTIAFEGPTYKATQAYGALPGTFPAVTNNAALVPSLFLSP